MRPHPLPSRPSVDPLARRRALAALGTLAAAAALPGCGGGGGDEDTPRVLRFDASPATAFVGEQVLLRADYAGGSGRIEPGIGAVARGAEVLSPVLDADRSYRLVVERPGAPAATRNLAIGVRFRDRYQRAADGAALSEHAAVAAADGTVLLLGGSRGEGSPSFAIDRFDPASGRVTRIGNLLQGRLGATATRLDNGTVLLAGGSCSGTDWRAAELVDERTGVAQAAGALSVPRLDAAAVALRDGRVLVLGGLAVGEGNPLGLSRSAELWDPATRRFRRLAATMAQGRANHSATLLPDGRVLVAGGYSAVAEPVFAEIFDPVAERFTPVADAAPLRAQHLAFATAEGQVWLLGGETVQGDTAQALSTTLRFDPATQRFAAGPALRVARSGPRGVLLPGGAALLFGGHDAEGQALASAERVEPAGGGAAIAPLDRARQHHSVTRLASGRVAVIGGDGAQGFATTIQVYE